MDKNIIAILLSFSLYGLYVFLPIVPSMVLYKMFPNEKITASGIFSNFKFNATGAFGGYIITVFLGWGLVSNIQKQIEKIPNPTWIIKTKLELYDSEKKLITNHNKINKLKVEISPELVQVKGNIAIIKLPGNKSNWGKTLIDFKIPEHGSNAISLSDEVSTATVDEYNLSVTLSKPIKIYQTIQDNVFLNDFK